MHGLISRLDAHTALTATAPTAIKIIAAICRHTNTPAPPQRAGARLIVIMTLAAPLLFFVLCADDSEPVLLVLLK